jgi:hypothetical protein
MTVKINVTIGLGAEQHIEILSPDEESITAPPALRGIVEKRLTYRDPLAGRARGSV